MKTMYILLLFISVAFASNQLCDFALVLYLDFITFVAEIKRFYLNEFFIFPVWRWMTLGQKNLKGISAGPNKPFYV